jgi:trimethylamine--corrinoid protein Co-methyltransferase
MCPKYLDPDTGAQENGRMEHVHLLAEFAHAEARVGGIAAPLSLSDRPAKTASIEAFLALAERTDKVVHHVEPFFAEVVPYLAELSDVFLGPNRYDEFMDHCNCVNPVLRLEERTAGVMLARAKYGVTSLVTSMPAAGGTAPVTVDGAVVQGVAEIVGGLVISWILNPDANNVGYISSGAMDFLSGTMTQSAPESVLVDVGVVEVMDHAFGGNTRIGGTTYVAASRPGFAAVFEKALKGLAYGRLGHPPNYAGGGVLENGALFSPQQLLLDMDAQGWLTSLPRDPSAGLELSDIVNGILEVARYGNGDFLSHHQTLDRYRTAVWEPRIVTRGTAPDEAHALAAAARQFRETAAAYPGYEPDREKLAAGHEVLRRARCELLGL